MKLDPALPAALRGAVDRMLVGVGRSALGERAASISAHYRKDGGSREAVRHADDALAYAVARMPATYAAVNAALSRLIEAKPDFAPQGVLDLCCGPGTASFAAASAFPSIAQARLVDSNAKLLTLARALAPDAGLPDAQFVERDATALRPEPADLVTISYALVEMDEVGAVELARRAFAAAQVLVLVEPGSTQGFSRIRAARAALIAQGAHVLAPCPHDLACPMPEGDWCHFVQRLPRSRDHMALKNARMPYEDEKFSYGVFARAPAGPRGARILRPPVVAKHAVSLSLCTGEGLTQREIPKRAGEAYKSAKKADWGDAV